MEEQPNNVNSSLSEPNAADPTPPAMSADAPAGTDVAPTATAAPDVSGPAVVGAPQIKSNDPKSKSKKLLFIVALVVLVLLLCGGYVFGIYLPNQPSNIYKKSLTNSGKAIDTLIANNSKTPDYKSYGVSGNLQLTSSSVSFDGSLNGKFSPKGVGDANLKVDMAGTNLTLNARGVSSGSTYPDLYVQVSGVKNLLDSLGLSTFDSLDGQWLEVDHTLLASLAADVQKTTPTDSSQNLNFNPAQARQTAQQLNAVNKQYIFTDNSSKSVLTNQKFIAKETRDGQAVDHFKVGYNKANLTAYVNAVQTTLDASPLNNAIKQSNGGKDISQLLNFTALKKSIAAADSSYTFDVWDNTKTKLVQSVQFTDPKDGSTFTIAQNYTGGDTYPFSLAITGKDGNVSVNLSDNSNTNVVSVGLNGTATETNDHATFKVDLTVTPSTNDITETAPAGAQSVTTLLGQLGNVGLQ